MSEEKEARWIILHWTITALCWPIGLAITVILVLYACWLGLTEWWRRF